MLTNPLNMYQRRIEHNKRVNDTERTRTDDPLFTEQRRTIWRVATSFAVAESN